MIWGSHISIFHISHLASHPTSRRTSRLTSHISPHCGAVLVTFAQQNFCSSLTGQNFASFLSWEKNRTLLSTQNRQGKRMRGSRSDKNQKKPRFCRQTCRGSKVLFFFHEPAKYGTKLRKLLRMWHPMRIPTNRSTRVTRRQTSPIPLTPICAGYSYQKLCWAGGVAGRGTAKNENGFS